MTDEETATCEVAEEALRLETEDGLSLAASAFAPAVGEPLVAAVVGPAMGAPRRTYRRLARFLAGEGMAVLTVDLRGLGESWPASRRGRELTLADWGRYDLDAALQAASLRWGGRPLAYVGHSSGAQVIGLAPTSPELDALVMVAASKPYWGLWPGISRWGMFAFWHLVVPGLTAGRDWFPARRIGFSSVDIPAGAAAQWARWGRDPQYLFAARFGQETSAYERIEAPLLSWGFSDDAYAPAAAIEAMLAHFPSAEIERRHLAPSDLGLSSVGHFGFFRSKAEAACWRPTAEWLQRATGVGDG